MLTYTYLYVIKRILFVLDFRFGRRVIVFDDVSCLLRENYFFVLLDLIEEDELIKKIMFVEKICVVFSVFNF